MTDLQKIKYTLMAKDLTEQQVNSWLNSYHPYFKGKPINSSAENVFNYIKTYLDSWQVL